MTAQRPWWKTVFGIVVTAIMLFPVYWMVNVSLTKTVDMRADPPHWFPWNPTLDGYVAAFHDQLPALGTSLLIGLGTVVADAADRHAGRVRAGEAAPARGRSGLDFMLLVAQMIPAVVMAMGFYAIYIRIGMLNSVWGLIVADSTLAIPFAILLFTRLHGRASRRS